MADYDIHIKGGTVVERFVGVKPKNQLQKALDAAKG